MSNSPNVYNEEAFSQGKKAFLNDNGMIVNPYNKELEESDFMDWRIGYQIAKMNDEVEKRENHG